MAKVIGISGFENSIPFKKKHWPGLEEREYRISQGHDSAAVLVVDGRIVAGAAEERFSRKKHTGDFPIGAVSYCLETAGLKPADIDAISHGFDYAPYKAAFMLDPISAQQYREVFSREKLLSQVDKHLSGFPASKVHHVNHHLSHAASAYYTSGWDECLVVILDGMGEVHAVTVYHAHDNEIDKLAEITAQDSIGILYSTLTLHLGFDFNSDEYKIMGLAPYGDPARHGAFFERTVELRDDGLIRIPLLRLNTERHDRETYGATRRHLGEHLIPARAPDGDVTDGHRDVAAALQECLDRVMLHICGHFGRSTGLRRLAMAGGVALNCTANGRLLQSGLFDEIYVQPAAGDDGSALGAALWSASRDRGVENVRMPVPFLGPAHAQSEIDRALADTAGRIEITRFPDLEETCAVAARLIAAGGVLGWYRGRMEFGPRALGHRSILADPGHPEMRHRINAMVKMREAFRPFAPAVSLEQVHHWFEVPKGFELPYMIMTADVRPEHRAVLPAITHVNGSARVQTVDVRDNPEFHALLRAVGRATGREMVLNTSFNVKGQPIVNTPREAIDTFLGTGIEYLFLENALVRRAGQG
ncbi:MULTISPECIES: carbamoyltransferase family protein [Bradyrhizobium]|jgi:carbamoyltransferase|uniref:carbamoyltransferase family protein n=1 Tax=Bradyrhizobium TaxID=374 RepID=UPI000485B11B|nr:MULTISPECIES: carbamoyltransferase C-terminal domain-containing protein [Bradyrhizobium]MCS3447774.1 carbamoyltransferase [Bradyrhizobium elkanii]MCS3561087.1 carbamoyltransferase [Bradyrhizobium elkanii]MCW2149070.1 carbamoyltransferase [Bradyrhizobium elkanii]MCW2351841.1 carbamoyltransferase [Bradyrhizobium elkanii]MCW2372799.1 carbamoyltransferase [Bradyrhizobium elkanii]